MVTSYLEECEDRHVEVPEVIGELIAVHLRRPEGQDGHEAQGQQERRPNRRKNRYRLDEESLIDVHRHQPEDPEERSLFQVVIRPIFLDIEEERKGSGNEMEIEEWIGEERFNRFPLSEVPLDLKTFKIVP